MSAPFDLSSAYPNELGEASVEALGPYLGLDVLSVRHNMREPISEAFERSGQLIASPTGIRTFDDHAGRPLPWHTFQWTAVDRTSANAIRTFLDARKGRLVPFWVATCAWDLSLLWDVGASDNPVVIRRSGYTDYFFPRLMRRYIAIWAPGGTLLRKITDSVNWSATVEKITLDSPFGVGVPVSTRISYLTLCRLAEDMTTIRWFSTWGCEASIKFVELPTEVPA